MQTSVYDLRPNNNLNVGRIETEFSFPALICNSSSAVTKTSISFQNQFVRMIPDYFQVESKRRLTDQKFSTGIVLTLQISTHYIAYQNISEEDMKTFEDDSRSSEHFRTYRNDS